MSAENAVLDPSAMERLTRIGGDRLVEKMLVSFHAFANEKVSEISQAVSEENWAQAGQAAHALKSSAGNVGAVDLQRLSFALECAGRDADGESIPALVTELIAAFEATKSALAEIHEPGETS